MGYHGGVFLTSGGFYSLDTFFALSGFLITSLLISEWQRTATVRLGRFWARRARRLLPALLVMLLGVALFAAYVVPSGTYPTLRGDSFSALFYYANWHFIANGSNYFNQSALTSPLTHTWSLAVEEQFYLVWPLVVLGVFKFWKSKRVLLAVCVVGALASAVEMGLLYSPGDVNRLYYGTDTRAQSLLIGAALAVSLSLWADRRRRRGTVLPGTDGRRRVPGGDPAWAVRTPRGRAAVLAVGLAGVGVSAALWIFVSYNDSFAYRGGFFLAALATAAVLFSVVCSRARSWRAASRSRRFATSVGSPMACICGTFPSSSTSTTPGPGSPATRSSPCGSPSPSSSPRSPSTSSSARSDRGTCCAAGGRGRSRQWGFWARWPHSWPRPPFPPWRRKAPTLPPPPSALEDRAAGQSAGRGGLDRSDPGHRPERARPRTTTSTPFNGGILGCGVTDGAEYQEKGVDAPMAVQCRGTPPQSQWPTIWKADIAKDRPNVVMILAGRWEVSNRTYDGHWTNIENPTYAAYVQRQLTYAVQVAGSNGAAVVLMTAPCYDTGEQPDGQQWPEDSPSRLAVYNGIVRRVAASMPGTSLLNFNAMACPGGQYEEYMDGEQVRLGDGIHFTFLGGNVFAPKIWPFVVRLGQQHMTRAR